MNFDCVLIDFDGTFTLAEEEGAPFVEVYRADLSRRLDRNIDREWLEIESIVRENPTLHGWLFNGKLVAPGNADPYIRSTTVARMLMDKFGAFLDPHEREETLSDLYHSAYEYSAIVFRPGAGDVLERLLGSGLPVWVVTNSGTEAVTRKIQKLLPNGARAPGVRGNARKAFIEEPEPLDEAFAKLPETQMLPGLHRPIFLRRGRYYEVLREVWTKTGTRPERTLVVGDIYELDLALPLYLGSAIHLVTSSVTPDYELRFVQSHPAGSVSDTLEPVLARAGV